MRKKLQTDRRLTCSLALMTALAAGCDSSNSTEPEPNPTAESSNILSLPFFVVDAEGDPIDPAAADPGTPLYDGRAYAIGGEQVPVRAPDGTQVSWGEWISVEGSIGVECRTEGTYISLQLSGLIPDGVYTIWNITWSEDGPPAVMDPAVIPDEMIGLGPAGPSNGSESAFTASASGDGSITVTTPEGPLGTFGEIGACALTDEFEWHVVGLYHHDGQAHGSQLGPVGTMAEQFGFVFKSGT